MNNSRLIDPTRLGRLVRATRIAQGFGSVEEFLAEMERVTGGYRVSKEVFYKVESGKMLPRVDLWFAITAVLFKSEATDPILGAARSDSSDDPYLMQ